jgi:hypothetical protein
MATTSKKPFKLTIPGLFKWESEGWTLQETALILGMVMVFIIILILLLKIYVLPVWGGSVTIKQLGLGIAKIFKARSP